MSERERKKTVCATFNKVNEGSKAFENIYQNDEREKKIRNPIAFCATSSVFRPPSARNKPVSFRIWIYVEFRISISFCVIRDFFSRRRRPHRRSVCLPNPRVLFASLALAFRVYVSLPVYISIMTFGLVRAPNAASKIWPTVSHYFHSLQKHTELIERVSEWAERDSYHVQCSYYYTVI